jgi:hypothetical protein
VRSDDYGTTWTMVGNGLQGGVPPIELPDGRLAAVGQQTVVVSADRGVTWAPIGETLPFKPQGLIYSPRQQAFYIWRGACTDEVARDAIMRLDISL